MKWIISRQLPHSPPPQQGASDPISGHNETGVQFKATALSIGNLSLKIR